MPALNYDYDYYEYINGRRVGSVAATNKTSRNINSNTQKRSSDNNRATVNKVTNKDLKMGTINKTKKVAKSATKRVTKKPVTSQKKLSPKKNVTKKPLVKKDLKTDRRKSLKEINKPREMTLTKPKAIQNKKGASKNILAKAVLGLVLFSLFFMICYRYSLINEEFLNVKNLKSELSKIQTLNGQIEAEIENKTDLKYVENYAKYQLGMQKPSTSQIQYITVEKQDKITVPVVIEEEEQEETIFTKILKEIMKIID